MEGSLLLLLPPEKVIETLCKEKKKKSACWKKDLKTEESFDLVKNKESFTEKKVTQVNFGWLKVKLLKETTYLLEQVFKVK